MKIGDFNHNIEHWNRNCNSLFSDSRDKTNKHWHFNWFSQKYVLLIIQTKASKDIYRINTLILNATLFYIYGFILSASVVCIYCTQHCISVIGRNHGSKAMVGNLNWEFGGHVPSCLLQCIDFGQVLVWLASRINRLAVQHRVRVMLQTQ